MRTEEEKARHAAYMRKWLAANPIARAKSNARSRARYASLTSEQRAKEAARLKASAKTPEGRAAQVVRTRKYRAKMTPEQHDRERKRYKTWAEANIEKRRMTWRKSAPKVRSKRISLLEEIAGRPTSSVCDICGEPSKKRLHFDHDHKTDAFRGWLCWRCNSVLGRANDDIELLDKMIVYLAMSRRPRIVRSA